MVWLGMVPFRAPEAEILGEAHPGTAAFGPMFCAVGDCWNSTGGRWE